MYRVATYPSQHYWPTFNTQSLSKILNHHIPPRAGAISPSPFADDGAYPNPGTYATYTARPISGISAPIIESK
jgi:hypothetical protein